MTKKTTDAKEYNYFRSTFYYNGKQYSATGKTQREADRKADAKKLAMERAEVATGGNMTVAEWAGQWLETYKAPSVGEGQHKNYIGNIKTLNAAVGGKKLKDVTPGDLQRALNAESGKSKSHVLHVQHTMQAIFRRARIERHISIRPCGGVGNTVGHQTLAAQRDAGGARGNPRACGYAQGGAMDKDYAVLRIAPRRDAGARLAARRH
jgi:hypothetical protein